MGVHSNFFKWVGGGGRNVSKVEINVGGIATQGDENYLIFLAEKFQKNMSQMMIINILCVDAQFLNKC